MATDNHLFARGSNNEGSSLDVTRRRSSIAMRGFSGDIKTFVFRVGRAQPSV